MKKITAIILALVLAFAGTAAPAEEIHDALSELAEYTGNVSFTESIMSTIVETAPPVGVYIIATEDGIAVEYHNLSTVRQYGLVPTGDTTVQAASAAIAIGVISAKVLPQEDVITYINADNGTVGMYSGDMSDSELIDGMYNDIDAFKAFIENS